MYDRGVVSVAYSRGLLSSGGGGKEGGEEIAPTASGTGRDRTRIGAHREGLALLLVLLENYPQMHDADHCEVVQADGSVLGSAINCAVLALLDTGVAKFRRRGRRCCDAHLRLAKVSLDRLLLTVECARACSTLAMAGFFRIFIERKMQRKVQTIWS